MRGTALAAWTPYLALFSVAPGETGGGTELSGLGYARQQITFSDPTLGLPVTNTTQIEFGDATADWLEVSYGAIFTALTAGTMRYFGPLANARTILAGQRFRLLVGELLLTEE